MDTVESIVILYGSQTGTAQDAAESLGRRLKIRRNLIGRRLHIQVLPMNDYPIVKLVDEQVAIFVCSTTGQGEEPDNMKHFWSFLLRKDLPAASLRRLRFTVLGLGDSSYVQYNFAAKKLYKRLLQLDAKPLLDLALADDQHDLGSDAVLEPWSLSVVDKLAPIDLTSNHEVLSMKSNFQIAPAKYRVTICERNKVDNNQRNNYQRFIGAKPECAIAKLISNNRITASSHFQDVRLVKLNVSLKGDYSEGDVLMVQPQNLDENVDEFFRILYDRVDPNATVALEVVDPDVSLPPNIDHSTRCTWRQYVRNLFDVQATPRRYFYEILRHFATDELEREKLDEFLSADGQRELYNYGSAMRRTCLEVLQDFPNSARAIPTDYYFDLFPTIRARAFSIASSPSVHPDEVHILVAVVEYKTKLVKPRRGLCSTWLSRLTPGDHEIETPIPVWLRKGSFRFPPDNGVGKMAPVIMIGPGTGCAPFRSYIQRRIEFLKYPGSHLFFGCRNKAGDFFFEQEWSEMQAKRLLSLYVAFSRDQEEKIYVQHKLLENGPAVWDVINAKGAYIFLAGNAKQMPQDVKAALQKVFIQHGNMDDEAAASYLKMLERTRRFQSETWS